MPRIRSIRPEFFSDARMAQLTPYARLFYQALWCFADDEGRGRCIPRELEGFAFPYEPNVKAVELLVELENAGRIVTYSGPRGEQFYHIPTFNDYQKPNKPMKSRFPAPPDTGQGVLPELSGSPTGVLREQLGVGDRSKEIGGRSSDIGHTHSVCEKLAAEWGTPTDTETACQVVQAVPALEQLDAAGLSSLVESAKQSGTRFLRGLSRSAPGLLPKAPKPVVVWCGSCEESNRMVSTPDGDMPCGDCHPGVVR